MPHLRFDLSTAVSDDQRAAFADWVAETYAEVMATGTGHVGVLVRETGPRLGRAGPDEEVALVDCDVRAGRSRDQRRDLARRLTAELESRFGVPAANVYVVFTEHEGGDFVLGGEPLTPWDDAEGGTGDEANADVGANAGDQADTGDRANTGGGGNADGGASTGDRASE